MATINNPRGFVEHRHLSGSVSPRTTLRRVKADGASGAHQKFPGDPVVLVSGNTVARIPAAATAASLPVLGVIRSVLSDAAHHFGRPLTHQLPSGGNFIAASTAGWVEVNEDPFQTYLVNTDATVVSTLVGQYVDVTADTPNTAAGRSGMEIQVAGATNTAANTSPFQIVALADNNLDGFTGGEANHDVEVIIAQHTWTNLNKAR